MKKLKTSAHIKAIIKMTSRFGRRFGRPQAPVAEGGPVGFSDGGNRRDWFPEARGLRAA